MDELNEFVKFHSPMEVYNIQAVYSTPAYILYYILFYCEL